MTERTRGVLVRHAQAVAAVVIATVARVVLDPFFGDGLPLVTFFLALVIVATRLGFGPSMVVIAGTILAFPLIFHAPRHSFALPSGHGVMVLMSFVVVGTVVAATCSAMRAARRRAEAGQEALRREMSRRERAEQELRDRETRWHALIENSSDAITLVSPEGVVLYVSASITKITGFAPEELVGTSGFGYIHPDDREAVDRARAEVLSRPFAVSSSAFRLRHKSGAWRRVEAVATNRLDEPAIGAIVVNTRDVTERFEVEDQLRRSDARFRIFMDHSPAITYLKDESGRYVWVNNAWVKQFDRPVDELLGQDDLALWPEETARTFRESDRSVLETGRVVEVTEAVGDRHFMSLKFPVEYDGTRLVGGKTLDVTDRVRAQEAVRRSEALLLALADSMPQIVWAARPDGRLDYYNKRWFEYTGFSEEQSYAVDGWAPILHPDDLSRCLETWATAVRTGEPYEIEYRFHDRVHGGYRWHLGRALPVRDESGQIVRWYGTCTDIDDQKRAEAAAEAANQAKNRFLAVLSHELRTPLTPVLLTVSSHLEDPSANLGDTRPVLELVRQKVMLESRLIDDLLDVTRIVRGTFSLAVEPCDVHSLIALALEICRADLEAAGVVVSLDLSAPEPGVVADPSRLQQVFWNLIKNAAKFSPRGGPVTIRTRADPGSGRLVIEVADSGVGIAPEFLSRVFEAFEQGETSPWTREFGGLGLGLAISRAIVSAHSGEITVESDGPGRGSTFRVVLPTATNPATLPAEAGPLSQDPSPRSALRILLVEDDRSTLSVLSRLLRLSHHEVTTADSVSSAIAAADHHRDEFDIIISDIGLPDGNGMDLMRALQARRKFPAIALTGFGMDDDIRRGHEAGFSTHLTKPVDFRTLEATIRELVSHID